MTPQAEERLRHIHTVAANMLQRLSELLPPDYKLTLIARNTKIANAQMMVTDEVDADMEILVNEILTASKHNG